MDARQQRGLEIAAQLPVVQKDGEWVVPSQAGKGKYKVKVDSEIPFCSCPDYETHRVVCKHIHAVRYTLQREQYTDGQTTITTTTETVQVTNITYSQDWPNYNRAQTSEKRLFRELMFALCQGVVEPERAPTRGRPALPVRDMLFSAAYKVYSTVSGRRFMTDLSEAHASGYISKLPCYNSISNYFEDAALTPVIRELITNSALPLKSLETDFAVDSTGLSTHKFVRWFSVKHERVIDNHDWIKLHLVTGVKTNVVTSVEVSGRHANDAPYFKPLAESTVQNFNVKEMSGDKAYSSQQNLAVMEQAGGTAFVPFKINATGEGTEVWRKMYHFYEYNRTEFLAHYHKRSNVESTFHMIKAKFGHALRSKTETAIINEALLKVLCHNVCCVIQSMFEFVVEPDFLGNSGQGRLSA